MITHQWKRGTSRQLPRLKLVHAKIHFNLRGGIVDEADYRQRMKDVRVLIFAVGHHLGMRVMVWRQDPYTGRGDRKRAIWDPHANPPSSGRNPVRSSPHSWDDSLSESVTWSLGYKEPFILLQLCISSAPNSKRNPGTKPVGPWHSGNVTDTTTFPINKTHRVSQKKWALVITA